MDAETTHWFALTFLSGLSHGDAHDLLACWRSAGGKSLRDLFEADGDARAAAGLAPRQCAAIDAARQGLSAAAKALKPCELAKIHALTSDDPVYPPLLETTLKRARPPLLFCAGNVDLLREPMVAIIGSRQALPVSLEFAHATAAALAAERVVVVSGFAEGVDRRASYAALENGGATVLVLAQGLLTFGRGQQELAKWIEQGKMLAVSAYTLRAPWQTSLAMARNGIITALANDVVVAQAREGGAWEAARGALRQGKRVWIRADDSPGLGHRALIQLGARPVEWPSEGFREWVRGLADNAAARQPETAKTAEWTEAEAMKLLREGSAADIHDACGMTGHVLTRIIEGRNAARLLALNDLCKIKGLGAGAAREVASAFGLKLESDDAADQVSLFPAVEEFPGWDV
jgi:DNA processing protein